MDKAIADAIQEAVKRGNKKRETEQKAAERHIQYQERARRKADKLYMTRAHEWLKTKLPGLIEEAVASRCTRDRRRVWVNWCNKGDTFPDYIIRAANLTKGLKGYSERNNRFSSEPDTKHYIEWEE